MAVNSNIRKITTNSLARIGTAILVPVALILGPSWAQAEIIPSLNLYGTTGLIDTPSGDAQPDGQLSLTSSYFGPISRTTLSFQITPRLSGSFRFLGIQDWNANSACQPSCANAGIDRFDTYYDRSFDVRYKVFDESRYVPAVTIGLQDLAGTGILSGEYIAATKTFNSNLKVTAGLGWGRLGSAGSIGSPFGERDPIDVGFGGNFNIDQWFRGPVAPFGGVEWKLNDKWTLKGEYSSDNYSEEARNRGTFERKSPFNFGIEYQSGTSLRFGAYHLYGSEIGLVGHILINPKRPSGVGIAENAPVPVSPRPSKVVDPGAWTASWVTQPGAGPILRENIAAELKDDGIFVEALRFDANIAQVRIRSTLISNNAQAIGRVARVMSKTLPASVELFEIVPIADGLAASKVVIRRSDLERLEFSTTATSELLAASQILEAEVLPAGAVKDTGTYPKFNWGLEPYLRVRVFDQNAPLKADLGARLSAGYQLSPGLRVSGSVTQKAIGNLQDRPPLPRRGSLQPVRSAVYYYDRDGTSALEKLTVDWNRKVAPSLYGRVSVGYLERMFGGVSTGLLWKRAHSRLALGVEVNYLKQRAPNGGFGFTLPGSLYETDENAANGPSNYSVLTGHVSAYYELAQGLHVQVDVGRYLAGDIGATLSVDREFANGWRVGAFMTKTNVSAENFGSGSFDKGIRLEVPLGWLTGKQTRETVKPVLRPFGRDGGARLEIDNRLYESVRGYHAPGLEAQFGRFWK
jgi:hypothetical protein